MHSLFLHRSLCICYSLCLEASHTNPYQELLSVSQGQAVQTSLLGPLNLKPSLPHPESHLNSVFFRVQLLLGSSSARVLAILHSPLQPTPLVIASVLPPMNGFFIKTS